MWNGYYKMYINCYIRTTITLNIVSPTVFPIFVHQTHKTAFSDQLIPEPGTAEKKCDTGWREMIRPLPTFAFLWSGALIYENLNPVMIRLFEDRER